MSAVMGLAADNQSSGGEELHQRTSVDFGVIFAPHIIMLDVETRS